MNAVTDRAQSAYRGGITLILAAAVYEAIARSGMFPAGYGHMRASTAERERVIDVLKAAFAEGRLTQDECEQRVGQALSARTYAELAPITADLPAGPPFPRER